MLRPPAPLRYLSILVWVVVALVATQGRARIEPYYLVSATTSNTLRPRFVWVLDTSNSMEAPADPASPGPCELDCETPGALEESRMSVVRRAISATVERTKDRADFALLTFDQFGPPSGAVPAKCGHTGGDRRFMWVTTHDRAPGSPVVPVTVQKGYQGAWTLCGGDEPVSGRDLKKPYPYLRWDELGVGSVITANNETSDLPPSPLIAADLLQRSSVANAHRRVQWFPEFMGVRTQLNATTDPDESILSRSVGDYGTAADMTNLRAQVQNQDFYYWPYVDGFPGYTFWRGYNNDAAYSTTRYRMGVTSGTAIQQARLHVPFFLDASTYDTSSVPAGAEGPRDRARGLDQVSGLVDTFIRGGLDPYTGNGTPWASSIGDIPATPIADNSPGSHTTVASYLATLRDLEHADAVCAPLTLILVTDGAPSPFATEGGPVLNDRLAQLRRSLGARVYVLGAFEWNTSLNDMACAGAGACDGSCSSPCDDVPANGFDTCANPSSPATECAFTANDVDALVDALTRIMQASLETEASASQTSLLNDTIGEQLVQTQLRAYTEWPGWKGHVERKACTDPDLDDPTKLAGHCATPDLPDPRTVAEPVWGPCPRGRQWDAGVCLQQTSWAGRRLYFRRGNGVIKPILKSAGTEATGAFRGELILQGLIPNDTDADANALAIAQFIAGKDWPEGWKLPGLANSTPVLVRRVPEPQSGRQPAVPWRDPHCAGRNAAAPGNQLPTSFVDFARDAWDPALALSSPSPHQRYQEAILVGDDLGLIHAFHADSGNEMWALLPSDMLATAAAQAALGPENRGQPSSVSDHLYGTGSTANQGFVWDPVAAKWRHIAVIGYGPGGREYMVMDVSHMSPGDTAPQEVLWTTEDAAVAAAFEGVLGETWSRPALTYSVAGDSMSALPEGYLVMASGYPPDTTIDREGRVLALVDVITGAIVEQATFNAPSATVRYDADTFGLTGDPVVTSHCLSRYWAEMQEVYVAGPEGRVYRWDLGWRGSPRDHESDSVGLWDPDTDGSGTAAAFRNIWACQGTGTSCTVKVGSAAGGKREPFRFSPAVSAIDRIDDLSEQSVGAPTRPDTFLLAAISGSPSDASLSDVGFHSSLFIIADDHESDRHGGVLIPSGSPKGDPSDPGANASYLRLALSDLTRTRTFTPFAGSATYEDTALFSAETRPIRPPRIAVRAVGESEGNDLIPIDGVEHYEITFTVHEPAVARCDPRWRDPATDEWYADLGSVYEVRFTLPISAAQGIDFANGTGNADDFGNEGLTLVGVEQYLGGSCEDGNCGAVVPPIRSRPCVADEGAWKEPPPALGLQVSTADLRGFTPAEPG